MVSQFLQLKLAMIRNSFRRRPAQLGGIAVVFLYATIVVIFVVGGLMVLRDSDIETARSAVVILGSFILCIYAIAPVTLGMDDALEPRKFGPLGISTTRLTANLLLLALLGLPSLLITIIAVAQTVTWARGALPTTIAIVSAALIVVTCVLASRITATIASFALASRRARDRSALIGIFLLLGLTPVVVVLTGVDWGRGGLATLGRVAGILGWTPLGAAWAAPADAAGGDVNAALLKLLIALGWAGVLFFFWRQTIAVVMIAPERRARRRTYVGLGWFELFPRTPVGVIAARTLTYWGRDARYGTSFAAIPFIPFFLVLIFLVAGFDPRSLALLPVPLICLFLGWSAHNDVAFDNTALWLHLSTSTAGRADRWGRIIPLLWLGIPVLLVGSVLSALLYGDWSVVPALVGVSASLLFSGLGISSITSARSPYPTVHPGDSPFAQPQGNAASGTVTQSLSLFGTVAVSLPTIGATIMAVNYGGAWALGGLALGIITGTLVLALGVSRGARIYNRRTSELLEFALQN